MIEITQEQIERVNLILSGVPKAVPRAFYNVINRGLSSVRSESNKEMTSVYTVNQSDLRKNQKISVKNATSGSLEGSVSFEGNVIPLMKFKVSPTEPRRKTVSVSVMKGEGTKRLNSAFVANLGKYGVGVFERLTSKRESSQQLFGPSVAHMMDNQNVLTKVEKTAQGVIDRRVEQEIIRILNGYGGK